MLADVRKYMSNAILIAICVENGESYDHLMEPCDSAHKALSYSERACADARITAAVDEILRYKAAPRMATLADGPLALTVDEFGRELTQLYREQIDNSTRPEWRDAVHADIIKRIGAAKTKEARGVSAR